jgi:hypothetical protein
MVSPVAVGFGSGSPVSVRSSGPSLGSHALAVVSGTFPSVVPSLLTTTRDTFPASITSSGGCLRGRFQRFDRTLMVQTT